jgi:hypothetical protein
LIDAVTALRFVDVLDRRQVRDALAATMIKDADRLATFQLLFDLHFPVRTAPLPDDDPAATRRSIITSLDRISNESELAEGQAGAVDFMDRLIAALERGDEDAMRALAAMAINRFGGLEGQPDATERYFMHRILRALELSKLMREMLSGERRADADGPLSRAELSERIETFKRLLAGELRNKLVEVRGPEDQIRALELGSSDEIDFLGASPRQMAAMREAIRPLARALATKIAKRRRRQSRGRLDVRRTVRRSLSAGGVLLDPAFRRPKVARPDLFLLCDVSGSVAEFASFTLTLLQAMTQEFSRMRSFAFVDDVDEVTDHLADVANFLEVRHVLYRADVVGDDGHSDYGAVFERFWTKYGEDIDGRSTIIITGDARSNYRDPRLEILRTMQMRARRVYLLNPEPKESWGDDDSIVEEIGPVLDGMYEVRNLRQLGEAVLAIS